MNDRYVVMRKDHLGVCDEVLCRGSGRIVWAPYWALSQYDPIQLTKEGAEQMALNLGGTARKLVSPNNPEADR